MSKIKITVNAEVRALLVELDQVFERFSDLTHQLGNQGLEHTAAVDLGTEREHVKALIVGVAYRLNKASNGQAAKERREEARSKW